MIHGADAVPIQRVLIKVEDERGRIARPRHEHAARLIENAQIRAQIMGSRRAGHPHGDFALTDGANEPIHGNKLTHNPGVERSCDNLLGDKPPDGASRGTYEYGR